MFSRRWAIVWAAASSLVVLAIGLQLPLWKRAYGCGYCVSYESVPVWTGLADRAPVPPMEAKVTGASNRNACIEVLGAAGLVGAIVYYIRRPPTRPLEAVDYVDGPGGAVVDGRAG